VIDPDVVAGKRPYVVIGVFTVAMLLTPPDAFSQTLLAIPMLLLFEIGIFFSRRLRPRDDEQQDEPAIGELDGALAGEVKASGRKSGRRHSKRT